MSEAAEDLEDAEFNKRWARREMLAGARAQCLTKRERCNAELEPDNDGLFTCRACGEQFDYP